jgi:hypothetical protein
VLVESVIFFILSKITPIYYPNPIPVKPILITVM